eukprot:Skav215062  [mRNA]  locus=scaffold1021:443696:444526:- [translate_table: standard]
MILVMHWAVKQRRLQKLLRSTSISISTDDRKDYRVVRYRCNLGVPGTSGPQDLAAGDGLGEWLAREALASEGVLGVFRVGSDVPENTLESHDKDKSESMAETILEVLKRACESPEGQCDRAALDKLCSSIRHFGSDQGPNVAKVGKVLLSTNKLPNLIYLSFDPAHQIRIASKDPLQALPQFEKQWTRLFSGKLALLPAIHHSKAWQAKLFACQQEVLKVHGNQASIDRAVQSLSFAPHRFDSAATPLFKFCCLIRAISLLCGMQAADVSWQMKCS